MAKSGRKPRSNPLQEDPRRHQPYMVPPKLFSPRFLSLAAVSYPRRSSSAEGIPAPQKGTTGQEHCLFKTQQDGFYPPSGALKFTFSSQPRKAGWESYWRITRNIRQLNLSCAGRGSWRETASATEHAQLSGSAQPRVYLWLSYKPLKNSFLNENADAVFSVVTAMSSVEIELALSSQEHLSETSKTSWKHTNYLWWNTSNTFTEYILNSIHFKKSWRNANLIIILIIMEKKKC